MSAGPLLELQYYFFQKLMVEANERYDANSAETKPPENLILSLDFSAGRDLNTGHLYQLRLGIRDLRAQQGEVPYIIGAVLVGYFKVADGDITDAFDRTVQINGASILYAAAREQILTLTGRGPYPAIKLPAISLAPLIDKSLAEAKAATNDTRATNVDENLPQDPVR